MADDPLASDEVLRLREHPTAGRALKLALQPLDDEWPSSSQLSDLRAALDRRIADGEPPRLAFGDPDSTAALRDALADDPRELPSAEDLARLAESLRERRGELVRDTSPRRRSSRPPGPPQVRRGSRKVVALLVGVPALAAAAGGALWWATSGATPAPASTASSAPSVRPPLMPNRKPSGASSASAPPQPSVSVAPVSSIPPEPTPSSGSLLALPQRKPLAIGSASSLPSGPDELELIHQTQSQVAKDPGAALQLVERHARLFPGGVLVQEREFLRIRCLLGLGRAGEAQSRADSFASRYPGSAYLGRIERLMKRSIGTAPTQ